jgi:uncharacterized membrane protein
VTSRSFRRVALRDALRGALWFLPTAALLVSLVLGLLLASVDVDEDSLLWPVAFKGSADDARQILIVVGATMITVTGLVFSLTIVALQIASSQFSPRLLRNFLRDRGNQWVLAVFVSTFAYSTAGLQTVGEDRAGGGDFVPRLAISGAMVFALASLAMLIYFINHLAHSIQIDHIMRDVERRTLEVIRTGEPEDVVVGHDTDDGRASGPASGPATASVDVRDVTVAAWSSGYVQSVDGEGLARLASERNVAFELRPHVGDYVVAGDPLLSVRAADGAWPTGAAAVTELRPLVRVGIERTMEQDIAFGIRQLVDIALRALSPAINDPYTAVQATDHLTNILAVLADRPLTAWMLRDADGIVRLTVPRPGFIDYVDLACDQIRRFGAAEPGIITALTRLVAALAARVTDGDRRRGLARQARLLAADAEREIRQPADLVRVERDIARLLDELGAPPTVGIYP